MADAVQRLGRATAEFDHSEIGRMAYVEVVSDAALGPTLESTGDAVGDPSVRIHGDYAVVRGCLVWKAAQSVVRAEVTEIWSRVRDSWRLALRHVDNVHLERVYEHQGLRAPGIDVDLTDVCRAAPGPGFQADQPVARSD